MRSWFSTICINCRSLALIQILSFTTCFFCIIYIILSNFAQLSVKNLIPQTLTGSNTNKSVSKQKIKYSSHSENKSFICDRIRRNDGTRETNVSSELDDHFLNVLHPYCDIVPIPRQNWIPAKRYVESDIVFIIFTGAVFYHTRATAVRDTWSSRVTHKYFFSATPYPSLPITVIEGAGEDYVSNMKKVYNGMQIAYREHNATAKFYFLVGCDTFVNVPHLLKRLERYDYQQPLIIGGHAFVHQCYNKKNQTDYKISYPSGGAGFFLSAHMMKLMQPKLNSYFAKHWPLTEDKAYTDIALSCLAHSMGVKPSFVPGFWAFNPEQTLKDHGKVELHADPEPNSFHYIHPLSMHVLDEFYVHQLLDRLGNDQNFDELMKFTRKFVITHYHLLRVKRKECTLPGVEPVYK